MIASSWGEVLKSACGMETRDGQILSISHQRVAFSVGRCPPWGWHVGPETGSIPFSSSVQDVRSLRGVAERLYFSLSPSLS